MIYAHVTDGVIDIAPRAVPRQWRHDDGILYTGLPVWPDDELLALGWFPVERVNFLPFDSDTQVRTGPIVTVETDKVVETYAIRDKTAQELDDEGVARALTELDMKAFKVIGARLWDQEKRIMLLEGTLPGDLPTGAEFRAELIAMWRAL